MLQLNTNECKAFRDTLALWHIADFDSKDEKITRSKRVDNFKGLIKSNQDIIAKSKNASEIAKREEEIKAWEKDIEAEKERVQKHLDAQAPNFEKGRNLITATLLEKFEGYLDDIYSDTKETELLEALVDWFTKNGAKGVVVDDVRKYIRPLGRKGASARQSCLTNRHTTREKGNRLKDAFLGALCDDPTLIALLPVHSWTNKIEKGGKKKQNTDGQSNK